MDKMVGNVMNKLNELDMLENTLVIFAADNGTFEDVYSGWPGYAPQGIIRGTKGVIREHGIRMPMIAYWKGKIAPGTVNSELIDYSDLFPTFLELGGMDIPRDRVIDGVSFAGQLNGSQYKAREHIFGWLWSKPDKLTSPRSWIISDQYKLYNTGKFFDIFSDPSEFNDLPASADPNIRAEISRHQAWMNGYPTTSPYWGG